MFGFLISLDQRRTPHRWHSPILFACFANQVDVFGRDLTVGDCTSGHRRIAPNRRRT
jgi:hypothetical protein